MADNGHSHRLSAPGNWLERLALLIGAEFFIFASMARVVAN
jgi:hypothetical protein